MGIKLFVVAVSMSLLAVAAQAQDKGSNPELVAKLEQMRSDSAHKAEILTAKPKAEWLMREARINRLIGQLKAGQAVDPKEIDEPLKEQYR